MNNPVSFELAKLLKEKGFDEPCPNLYYQPERCKKPTIGDVVMWLYEKYHTFISVVNEPNVHKFKWIITNLALLGYKRYIHSDKLKEMNEEETEYLYQHYFNSPIEAYEAGIKYILTKLI
jgi:oligoribonuclease NrnB/cAMP/cGMP phosphodiesterase (DHH superfamily)